MPAFIKIRERHDSVAGFGAEKHDIPNKSHRRTVTVRRLSESDMRAEDAARRRSDTANLRPYFTHTFEAEQRGFKIYATKARMPTAAAAIHCVLLDADLIIAGVFTTASPL